MKITTELRRAVEAVFPERHRFTSDQEAELVKKAAEQSSAVRENFKRLQEINEEKKRLEAVMGEYGLDFDDQNDTLEIRSEEKFKKVFEFAPHIITRKTVYAHLARRDYEDGVAYLSSIGIDWTSK